VSLIDRHGRIAFTYAKVHTCDFDLPERALTPGEDFHVAALDTAAGEVVVGAMICYDREFPESARVLMLKGVELILVPNACRLDRGLLTAPEVQPPFVRVDAHGRRYDPTSR
jgi:N-carbamoylputrescine amidase